MDQPDQKIPDDHLQAVLDIWSQKRVRTHYPISGNCMSPMIKDGDTLTIEHGMQDIHIGDVVAYGLPRRPAIHRVIKIVNKDGEKLFLLKPDRSHTPNPLISGEEILGRVIEIHGFNGRLSLTSFWGRWMNYFLAIRSYVAWKRSSADCMLWKGVNKLVGIRSKYFLPGYSMDIILWEGIRRAQRIGSFIEKSVLGQKRRG
jgi:hypothetical protein